MTKSIKIQGAALVAFLALAGMTAHQFYLAFNDAFHCESVVSNQYASPDKQLSVVVFEKLCDATVGSNTQAEVVYGVLPPYNFSVSFLSLKGKSQVYISWKDSKTLIVGIPLGVEVYRKNDSQKGVSIIYN